MRSNNSPEEQHEIAVQPPDRLAELERSLVQLLESGQCDSYTVAGVLAAEKAALKADPVRSIG